MSTSAVQQRVTVTVFPITSSYDVVGKVPNRFSGEDDVVLLELVKAGKDKEVKSILSKGDYRDRNYRDGVGRTALHWATEYGYVHFVKLLVEHKWDINSQDNKLQTPLHVACNHRNTDIALFFISTGCDINILDGNGNSPLQRAIHNDLEEVFYFLCESGADVNSKNKNQWCPLHEAVRVGNEKIVRRLIRRGADVNAVTEYKANPFSTAIFYYRIALKNSYSNLDSICRLLIDNRCYLSEWDGQWTPLMSTISLCNSYLAGLLLYHGCKIPTPAECGRSLIVEAFSRCDTNVVKLLVYCGYRVTPDEVEQCNKRIPTFSRSFRRLAFSGILDSSTNGHKIITWLRERSENVAPLSEICRASIRNSVNDGSRDKSIVDNIENLPLPRCLKDYVALEDLSSLIPA